MYRFRIGRMMKMFNLCMGIICIFFGVLNLMVGVGNEGAISQFNFALGLVCLTVGGMRIGIWIGED